MNWPFHWRVEVVDDNKREGESASACASRLILGGRVAK